MASHGGIRVGSGRKPGKVAEPTRLYREVMRGHVPGSIDKLIQLRDDMNTDPSVSSRICQWICEQAHGKARQSVLHEDGEGNVFKPTVVNFTTGVQYSSDNEDNN